MKERIGYYDIAKGLGIFLVVYTHICFNTSFHINEIIYTFYMPIVVGLFFSKDLFGKKFDKSFSFK